MIISKLSIFTFLILHYLLDVLGLLDFFTSFTGIVHQNDFVEQRSGRSVDNALYGPEQCGPGFIMEYYHNTSIWQLIYISIRFLSAPKMKKVKS